MEDTERIITFGEAWALHQEEAGLPALDDKEWEKAFSSIEDGSGLTVRIFTALGAWLGASCFIGLLAVLGWIDGSRLALTWGILFTSIFALSPFVKNMPPSLDPFLLAIGIFGQLFLGPIVNDEWGILPALCTSLVVESLLLATTKSQIQRFFSTVVLFMTGLGFLHYFHAYHLTHLWVGIAALGLAYFWVNEPQLLASDSKLARFIEPVGTGISVSLMLLLAVTVNRSFYVDYTDYWWASTLLIGGGIVYVIRHIAHTYHATQYQWLMYAAAAIAIAPTVLAPGIACSILLILLGFYRGHSVISWLGTAALIIFVAFFYYNLQSSLMIKSFALMASGLVMLLGRMAFLRLNPNQTSL